MLYGSTALPGHAPERMLSKIAEANARLTAVGLAKRSSIIKELVDAKQLTIAAAMHRTTGKVIWFS